MIDGAFFWLAISAGAFALVTPCVFPMVPITASYFAKHGSGDRNAAVKNALLFGAGIVGTFTAAGLATSVLVGAAGMARFAANPWVNLAIAAMFVAFALNFFGLYEIRLPSSLLTRLDRVTRDRASTGGLGAALVGGTFAVTTFTCTAPFVGTLLVLASQGQWQQPVVGLLVFSATFAIPFVLLALAPRALARLPRTGGWLNSVKVVLGLVEVGAALKFISNADMVLGWGVFTRQAILVSWALLCGVIAVYVFARRPLRLTIAATFAAIGLWLVAGLDGRPLGEIESFLPPRAQDTPAGVLAMAARGDEPEGLGWYLNDLDGALAAAREGGDRVFIDFTGYTCTNCRWMESNMFTIPEVEEQLGRFVLARLFTDGEGEVYENQMDYQKEQFGTIALPLYAVVDGEGATVATFLGLTRDRDEFLDFLRKAL
ncbi:MAG: thioredoxin family protein [Gemmatimonadetes bacterium]|nr:thioredoxin family protein [Gemmatimonadota bacterium]